MYRYSLAQVASVILVTAGVILTTLSASNPKPSKASQLTAASTTDHTRAYATGIGILTLALVLSGFLGMVQERTHVAYARQISSKDSTDGSAQPPAWQESMFYIHLLSMPMFYFLRDDLVSQFTTLNTSPTTQLVIPSPSQVITAFTHDGNYTPKHLSTSPVGYPTPWSLPSGYIPLVLNTLTQIICVAGVHRLTSRVSSLTVTLVLVVRKAVSLLISVLLFGSQGAEQEKRTMMWSGAVLVLVGTVLYSIASRAPVDRKDKKD